MERRCIGLSTLNNTSSEWNISTDIYNIREMVDEIKAKYVEDEDETTSSN